MQKRPQGAPALGSLVEVNPPFAEPYRATVVSYLSTQFIVENEAGRNVVGVREDFTVLESKE